MPAFNIAHRITPMVQPNPNDCWAAAIAMALGMTVRRIKALAEFNGVELNRDGSLPDGNPEIMRLLCRGIHMRPVSISRIPAIERLATFMRRGPVVLMGRIRHRHGILLHALTIHRLVGEGRADNTDVGLVDPSQAGTHVFTYAELAGRARGPIPTPHLLLVR
ncbi:MAG: hypothetical protein HN849_13175 [Victivallales bacterium]|jgi:hypothetical protein|nr:hypothetical protein [Victivallales bacterium]MBT7300465.1 hypothetical protein [Victivallales bacterium]